MHLFKALRFLALPLTQGYLLPSIVKYSDRLRDSNHHPSVPTVKGNQFTVKAADGLRLKGSACGSGMEAIFFVHGWTCNRNIFGFQVARFQDRYLCVTYDQRGHGESEIPGDLDYATETLASDLDRVIESFDPESFVIAGHSMGGFAALKFYENYSKKYSGRFKGLALIDSTGTALTDAIIFGRLISLVYPNPLGSLLSALGKRSDFADRIREFFKETSAAYLLMRLAAFGKTPSARQVEFMKDMVMSTKVTTIALAARSCLDFDFSDRLSEVKVPTLILVGDKDRLTSLDANVITQSKMPSAELILFPGAGHCTLIERPDLVNIEIERFLDGFFSKD